jgi:chromosome segregation protein
MLKRLELIGFKSFADKTLLDFGPGITAVVGPNGSGKSNIVDAVRWILGEQSAKSLRGDEMADVIFNGSTTRRALGMAEVTLTLDNSKRALTIEADEVQVTRRVYRDGEGEYLINKQPARLRDIKEMFLGSGAGGSAYCIIEQGGVQAILEASTLDRRTIFEEAAGISRFKAKKIETLRKLENVEQNLLRLADILKELDEQLRKTKLQASKAQRYQEYLERLKALRVAQSLEEYHQHTMQLAAVSRALESLRASLAERTHEDEQREARLQSLERASAGAEGDVQRVEVALSEAKERLTTEAATHRIEQEKTAGLEKEIAKTRGEWQTLNWELARANLTAEQAGRELAEIEAGFAGQAEALNQLERELTRIAQRSSELADQGQRDKDDYFQLFNQQVQRQNEERQKRSLIVQLQQQRQRLQRKAELGAQQLTQLNDALQVLTQSEQEAEEQLSATRAKLADERGQRDACRRTQEQIAEQLAYSREQRGALASRINVLEGLERSKEGLSAGVKEVLALINQPEAGPWRSIVGLVADLLTVRHEYAPLIDIALGARAQSLLVRNAGDLAAALAVRGETFSGRVTFWPAPSAMPWLNGAGDSLPNHAGLIGSAARLVTCTHPEFAHLPEHLLGTTLVVQDLATARGLAAEMSGYRFVTLQGELLESNGELTVGAHHAESGILSRKSELRELRARETELDSQIAAIEQKLVAAREELARHDTHVEQAQQEIEILAQQATEMRSEQKQERQRHELVAQQMETDSSEIQQFDRDLAALMEALPNAEALARAAEQQVEALRRRQELALVEARDLGQKREDGERKRTEITALVAQAKEQRKNAIDRARQAQDALRQKRLDQRSKQEQLANLQELLRLSEQVMLRASDAMAQAYLDKDHAERQGRQFRAAAEALKQERQTFLEQAHSARQVWQGLHQQLSERELEANDLGHRREGLATRLREEHGLELVDLYRDYRPPAAAADAADAHEEIDELKRKMTRLGNVNPDALQELRELEARGATLRTQQDDLAAAKKSLDEIIHRINDDSRSLFTASFEAIRGHFQDLFRKLFGGGMADVVLEDPNDVLESGVDIVARPPGKELRSISLLSGGEKTLTAVALLLAIFRSKPSPFCLLDEVDAALDEANIGRFAAVLRDFLDLSQFIIITHAKKTMAAADVLYGVTMQESGISQRIAVRLEDFPDDEAAKKAG